MTDDTGGLAGVATIQDLTDFTEPQAFTEWWKRIGAIEYQRALHEQLPAAWHGAIRQAPGLAGLVTAMGDENAEEGGNDDFDAWWRLFGVVVS
jgi:hypothetical protein